MNQFQFSVSAEAFRKSLEKESKVDQIEETGDFEDELPASPTFFVLLLNWLKNRKPTTVRKATPSFKKKTV